MAQQADSVAVTTVLSDAEAIEALKSIKPKYYKITVAAKRNPNLTPAQFEWYWSNVHGPKAAKWQVKWGIQQYVQYHTRIEDKAKLAMFGMDILEWDGTAEVLTESLDTFAAALADPYYLEVLAPEEDFLFDKRPGGMAVTLGHTEKYAEKGKVLQTPVIPKREKEIEE